MFSCLPGTQACLERTEQCPLPPRWEGLTWHMRPVDSEFQGRNLFCSIATGVGLPSSGCALVSTSVQWAGKGQPLNGVTTQPSSSASWYMGTQTSCSQPAWPCPYLGEHHLNLFIFQKLRPFLNFRLGVVLDTYAGRPSQWGVWKGASAPKTPPQMPEMPLSLPFLPAQQPCLAEDDSVRAFGFRLRAGLSASLGSSLGAQGLGDGG